MKVYGVLDAVEYKMRFPKAFGQGFAVRVGTFLGA